MSATIVFWIIATGLLLALLFPLVRVSMKPRMLNAADETEGKIAALYRDRLQNSQAQFDNGELTEAEYQQQREELSHALARELQYAPPVSTRVDNGKPLLPWMLAVALPALAIFLYLSWGNPAGLKPEQPKPAFSVDDMVTKLQQRLQSNPDDGEGWRMLGRSYAVLGRFAQAEQAYAEAYKLLPQDVGLLLNYAEVIARNSGNSLLGKPATLVEEALKLQPDNEFAQFLKGIVLYQQGNPQGATKLWQSLLATTGDETIRNALQQLLAQSGAAENGEPATSEAAAVATVKARITLSTELAARTSPNDTVFIFAQAAQGPKMPLAVKRVRVADLPVEVMLDDGSAMTEQMRLSAFEQVTIVARVSKSGNAMAASGDLQGSSDVVNPQQQPSVEILIDRLLP